MYLTESSTTQMYSVTVTGSMYVGKVKEILNVKDEFEVKEWLG